MVLEITDKRNKKPHYPDVERSNDEELLRLGVETFGRWNPHCLQLVSQLAAYTATDSPPKLRRSIQHSLLTRWWRVLGISVQRIEVASLLRPSGHDLLEAGGHLGRTSPGPVPMTSSEARTGRYLEELTIVRGTTRRQTRDPIARAMRG